MDKVYSPISFEETMYSSWEKAGYFSPKKEAGRDPFCVILPLPNANGDLHLGHAMFTIEDIMVRYHRMKGDTTLWQSGFDHAGFETQFVFEKFLAKQGKSRFDYSRDDLYKAIWDFTQANRGNMESQLRRMGFSLDWSRVKFPLDPEIIAVVYKTFKKMHDDGLIYRGERLVNYCTKCGTSFSDLEVNHVEKIDPLYYLKYGPFILATVRPETKFGDTAVAVHPTDKRYKDYVGKEISFEGLLGKVKLMVVADDAVDPAFGTGVVKVTPAHDMTDYEISKRHDLPLVQVIGFDGKLTSVTGPYAGLRVKAARAKVVEDMQTRGMIDHIDEGYVHTVGTCYRCGTTLEPLPMSQWFVKVRPLADQAIKTIIKKEVTFIPKRFEKTANQWLTNFHDWNISRQIVWGIRIPAWRCETCVKTNPATEWIITDGKAPEHCSVCGGTTLVQDEDVFDTWFSSAQWPFATLQANSDKTDFETFYPTSVMETGYDILPMWVCRMLMVGLYVTDKVPFKKVYLHGLVRDSKGQKMSKSKGNVVNPIKMVDLYGADALRMALVFGAAAGNDISLSEDKVRGMRNFSNKLWNMTRFFLMNLEEWEKVSGAQGKKQTVLPMYDEAMYKKLGEKDKAILHELDAHISSVTKYIDRYRFSDAAQELYEFAWHRVADVYIEENKERFQSGDEQALSVYRHILFCLMKLLHPYMPFITENIYQQIPGWDGIPLIVTPWPKVRAC